MGFLDKLESAADAAASKGKEVAAVTKLKTSIASEEKNIIKAFGEIGKIVFESAKDDPENPVYELCQQIKKAQENIENLKAEIEKIKE